MTTEQVIKVLEDVQEKHKMMLEISVTDAARIIHRDSIELYGIAIEALEKQIPKSAVVHDDKEHDVECYCPRCGADVIFDDERFCSWCGQAIDYGEAVCRLESMQAINMRLEDDT